MRRLVLLVLLLSTSCGGLSAEDRASLNAQIRAEVRAELARIELERQNQAPEGRARDAGGEAEDLPAPARLARAGLREDGEPRYRVAPRGPSRGPDDALVTIVTFSDFECPFCSRVQPTLARLLREYPDDVRLVFRHNPLPFHQHARIAAAAAIEAAVQRGNEGFWQMHDLLFENQRSLDPRTIERFANRIGLDPEAFALSMERGANEAIIDEDQGAAARIGARGTPGFFINGVRLMGAQPYERFQQAVESELAVARRLVRSGVPRGDVYARLMREALNEEAPEAPDEADAPPAPEPDPRAVYRIPVDGRPTLGPANAPVTIVAFLDLQCPFCARVMPTLDRIRERYGRDVRIVVRNNPLPFHPEARPAAEIGLEVFHQRGADAYERYLELVFENQRSLDEDNLVQFATQAGARRGAVVRALDRGTHVQTIEADQTLARSVGASGTPAFFINGRNLRGAQPLPAFTTLIDEVLADARQRLADGTPARRLYERIIEHGATEAQFIDAGDAGEAAEPTYDIAVPPGAPSLGPSSAPVTLQIFSDFQCPFCARMPPTLDRIREQFGDQVRIVWRDYPLPFHDRAMPAARAAREVFRQGGNQAFWAYHDRVFENQRQLDVDTLVQLAGQIPGIDAEAVRRVLDSDRHRAAVQADIDAVSRAGARIGTPSTFINGQLVQGAQPYPAFEAAIQAALNER